MAFYSNVNKKKVVRIICILALVTYYFCLPKVLFDEPYSTVVVDKKGALLGARIASDGQWRFPLEQQIPKKLETCILMFEDEYFNYHWGVNPVSVAKAFLTNIRAGKVVRGGSTLSMQVIRLSRKQKRTLAEKVVEAIWATRLEFRYSKADIINLYASYAPFGGNVVGYAAASWRYFGHTATSLSWAEAATLAVLPNAPSVIHLAKERQTLFRKRNKLLAKLHQKNIINADEYELALAESLPEEPHPLPQVAPHLVSHLATYQPQNTVTTTLDKGIQLQVEEILGLWNYKFKKHKIRDIAAVILSVHTGEVLAYHGNSGFTTGRIGSQVDIVDAPRSTGSILKPFLLGAMLDEGHLLIHQLLPDIPVNINGFTPQNFSLQYEGAVPASEAISRSLNIPSVYMLKDYSVPKFYYLLQELGLTTLSKSAGHYGLSLILGGAEAKLGEVTAAYMQLSQAAQGLEPQPMHFVTSQHTSKLQSKHIYSAGAAWQVLDVLKEVYRPGEIDWKMLPSIQKIAWKTGTSHGFRDGWAVGVTTHYAVGVWVGNSTGEGNAELVGGRTAGPVLFNLFELLPQSPWFDFPSDEFIDVAVCRKSGHLSGRFCEEVDTVLVLANGLKTPACPYHHLVQLTSDKANRIHSDCADGEKTIHQNWFTLPPIWEWYYKSAHPTYQVLPPYKDGCGTDERNPMQFLYPRNGSDIILTKQMDGTYGELTLELIHGSKQAIVYWHLDGAYLGETKVFHKWTFIPVVGNHELTVVDDQGNTLSIRFSISVA